MVGRGQARRVTDSAVDIGDDAARSTHDVMVVVADTRLIAGDHAQWLDPTNEPDGGQRVENVVHGLSGDIGKSAADRGQDGLGVSVRMVMDRFQHGDPGPGHTKIGHTQLCRVIRRR